MRTRIHFFGLMLSTLALITACSKDDDGGIDPDIDAKNELTYDGQVYPLNLGAYTTDGSVGDHYNNKFHVFQLPDTDEDVVPAYLYLNLFSASEDRFTGGTFTFLDHEQGDVSGKHYFNGGYLLLNMHLSNEEAEVYHAVEGGTVKVSGSGRNYAIAFDLQLDDGERVVGSFDGPFEDLDDVAANMEPSNRSIQLIRKSEQTPPVIN